MNANDLTSIDQVRGFLSGTQRVVFEVAGDKQSRYDWIRRTLVKFDYLTCDKAGKGTAHPLPDEGERVFPGPGEAVD